MRRKEIEFDTEYLTRYCQDMVYNILHDNGFYAKDFAPLRYALDKLEIDITSTDFNTYVVWAVMRYTDRNRSNEHLCDYLVERLGEAIKKEGMEQHILYSKMHEYANDCKIQLSAQ